MTGCRIRTARTVALAAILAAVAGCASREAEVASNLTLAAASEIVDLLRDSNGDCETDMRVRQEKDAESKAKDPRYRVLVPRRQLREAESLLSLNKLPRPTHGDQSLNRQEGASLSAKSEMTKALLVRQRQEEIEQQLLEFEGVVWAKVMIAEGEPPDPFDRVQEVVPSASVTITFRPRECDGVDESELRRKAEEHVASAFDGLDRSRVSVVLVRQRYLGSSHGMSGSAANHRAATGSPRPKWTGNAPLLAAAAGLLLVAVGFLAIVNFRLRAALRRNLARQPLPGVRHDGAGEDR